MSTASVGKTGAQGKRPCVTSCTAAGKHEQILSSIHSKSGQNQHDTRVSIGGGSIATYCRDEEQEQIKLAFWLKQGKYTQSATIEV